MHVSKLEPIQELIDDLQGLIDEYEWDRIPVPDRLYERLERYRVLQTSGVLYIPNW